MFLDRSGASSVPLIIFWMMQSPQLTIAAASRDNTVGVNMTKTLQCGNPTAEHINAFSH